MLRRWVLFMLSSLFLLSAISTAAQSAVVQAVLFYSPTCPHCHDIIDHYLPPLQAKYGDKLQILYINVQKREGAALYYDACSTLGVPSQHCGGVPFMVIGDQYMLGAAEIPARMERLIDEGLARGGQNLSTLPLLWKVMEAQGLQGETQAAQQTKNWIDKFKSDLVANSLAVIVLLALVFSLLFVAQVSLRAFSGRTPPTWFVRYSSWLGALSAFSGATIAFSIVLGGETLPIVPAALIGLLLMSVSIVILTGSRSLSQRYALVPLVIVAGLLVAGYMSYVEVGQVEAVCGMVGNCNAVQGSEYASVLGIPVGVLGILGYSLMLAAWAFSLNTAWLNLSKLVLLILLTFGVAFSAYLTFLEPFVIGASCAWCLTSALVILAILWLSAPTILAHEAPAQSPTKRIAHQPSN